MKNFKQFSIIVTLLLSFVIFGQSTKTSTKKINMSEYASFGEKFTAKKILSEKGMLRQYKNLKKGDTVTITFTANIKEVCKKKGCWMNLDLTENTESFVRFQDYGFFVPLNADGSKAIVKGKAYLDVVSVDELKHFAKDAKKSQEEIDKITKPKITYAFMATGVMIKKS